VSDPEETVCIVQDDGSGDDQACDEEGHRNHYGRNNAENGAYVDSPTGQDDQVFVRAHESCGHWHLHNAHRYGFQAKGEIQDVEVDAQWRSYDVDPNHNCVWNNDYRDGNRLRVLVTVDGETISINWYEQTVEDCETGETHDECQTQIKAGPAGEEDAGCPAGGPPAPPSPDEFPYGRVLP
jgi:hypothetical protein